MNPDLARIRALLIVARNEAEALGADVRADEIDAIQWDLRERPAAEVPRAMSARAGGKA